MSNYLTSLVARNLGQAEVLQPRVASLFEPVVEQNGRIHGDSSQPVAFGPSLAVEEFDAEDRTTTARSTDRIGSVRMPTSSSELHVEGKGLLTEGGLRKPQSLTPIIGQTQGPRDLSALDPEQPAMPQAQRPAPQWVPIISRAKGPRDLSALDPERPAMPQVQRPAPKPLPIEPTIHLHTDEILPESHEEKATPNRGVQANRLLPQLLDSRLDNAAAQCMTTPPPSAFTAPRARRDAIAPLAQALAETVIQGPAVPDAFRKQDTEAVHPDGRTLESSRGPLVAQPRIASLPGHKRPQGQDMLSSEVRSGPTIHVTIGRVEVRATMPAQPSAKPRSVPKTMSLEEYLLQRSGRAGS